MFYQGIAHDDDFCVKLAFLKVGIDEKSIALDEVLIAKTSLGVCSQEIHMQGSEELIKEKGADFHCCSLGFSQSFKEPWF